MLLEQPLISTKADDLIIKPVYVGEDELHRDQFVKLTWSHPENGNADRSCSGRRIGWCLHTGGCGDLLRRLSAVGVVVREWWVVG